MPVITAATLVALTVLLAALSVNVSRLRMRHRVSYGDGGHKDLLVATRAHGNTLEQSLLFVLLMLLNEFNPARPGWLAVVAGLFVLARLLHSAATFGRWLRLRQLAHLASVLLQLALAAMLAAGLLR